jgi:diacylglycerol kinase family enzyme
VVVGSDAEARDVVVSARRAGVPVPTLGLLGGDLCRTLGGTGDPARLRSGAAVTFPADLGTVMVDGRQDWFVAHAVARTRLWTRAVLALNAQWLGSWNVAPRAHPDDALLDVYAVRLAPGELTKVRARLPTGTHLPHPGITERRVPSATFTLDHPLVLRLDGTRVGPVHELRFGLEPDALTVVV